MLNNAEVSASLVFHTPSQTAQTDIWQVQLEKKQNFFEIKQKKKKPNMVQMGHVFSLKCN